MLHPQCLRVIDVYRWKIWILCSFCYLLAVPLVGEVPYTVTFEGISSGKTLKDLQEISEVVTLRSRPPTSLTALRRRAERDVAPLTEMLRGLGYYDATVAVDVEQRSTVHLVRVIIGLGTRYHLSAYNLLSIASHPDAEVLMKGALVMPDSQLKLDEIPLSELNVKLNKPALAKPLIKSRELLLEALATRGYPLAQVVTDNVIADRSAKTLSVTLYLNSGPRVTFGTTTIEGLQTVDEEFVRAKIAWHEDEPFHPEKVEATRENLERSQLFASALIAPAGGAEAGNRLPMLLELKESKHRSIAFGVSFTSDLGPGLSTEWEHRNMRGLGEKLNILAELESKRQRSRALYRKPDFRRVNRDLVFSTELLQQHTDSFNELTAEGLILIERKVDKHLRYSYGGGLKYIATDNSDNNRNRALISTPLKVRWSNANDPLDPTSGQIYLLQATPQAAIPSVDLTYLKTKATLSAYKALTQDEHIVLAGKLTLGSIFGAARAEIPPPDRFYAGTESLLRGYERLTVSPLNAKGKPKGGRSLAVANVEIRVRATEKLGWVGFFEIGNVWSDLWPQLNRTLLKSVGTGLRYHTPIGPVRLDIGVPLNRRSGIDEAWEFYLNIGQAF